MQARQLVAYNFQGTFKGMGRGITVIEALPYLPVTFDNSHWCLPNTTTCLWPTLMIFVNGDISISDLSIHITATNGTATVPQPDGGNTYIETGIRIMGRYTTNVHIDRVEEEGRPDNTSPFGYNVTNGIGYMGELISSPDPFDSRCGAAGGLYFMSGTYTVRNSSFKSMTVGVGQDGCVRSSQITIGGSPFTGNTFEDHWAGIDLESAENSSFEVSYNTSSAIGNSMWVIPWIESIFLPSKPSRYLIHDNTFITTGTSSFIGDVAGILLYSDTPDNPWIDAVIWNNSIQLQESPSDGIDAVNTKGTVILNNTVTGSGWDAVGLYGSTSSTLMLNNVSGFTPDSSTGSTAQIYLDSGTNRNLVVCAESTDTVLNQGTNNVVVGCQQAATTPEAETRSEAPGSSVPHLRFPIGKHPPYRP
jgi:hypothetical protein